MEQCGGLFDVEVRSPSTSAAVRLLQTRRPDGVRLASGSRCRRPVPAGLRRATMELLVHSARAEVPTRLDGRYNHKVISSYIQSTGLLQCTAANCTARRGPRKHGVKGGGQLRRKTENYVQPLKIRRGGGFAPEPLP